MLHPAIAAPLPQYYCIDVSSHCNLRCPFCATGNGTIPMAERGTMTQEHFRVIFDKIRPHAEVIQLFNWGEPFMHKRLLDYIETISAAGIETQVSSNLSVRRFTEPELERIVRSGLTSLLASIDGTRQTEYAAYRRGGNLSKAMANMRGLLRTRDRLGATTPHVIWGYHVNRHNEEQVPAARRLAAKIGVAIWFRSLSCPEDFQTRLLREAPSLFRTPEGLGRLWRPRSNRGVAELQLDPRLPQTCGVCRMPFEILNINHDGGIYPCTVVTDRSMLLGNLVEELLEEIWNVRMAENRRQLLDVDTPRPASQCGMCKHFRRIAEVTVPPGSPASRPASPARPIPSLPAAAP